MKFSHPYLLFLLWGLVPLLGILVYGIIKHKRILGRFARPGVHPYILPGVSYTRKWMKTGLILTAACLALVALAGPKAGFRWEKTTQKGVDIMVALDCSRSMLARDVSPTRLTRAKREIIDLTRLLHSDRAGLVAFAGQAVLQCPLTLDYQAFQIFLDTLEPDYLPVGGTDLTAALSTCYKGFDIESDTDKAVILITDGEDTAGGEASLDELTRKFADENIRIFAIGVGDPAGAPIPEKKGGFKKDGQGNIILSRVDETMLKKITAATHGRYVRSVAGDMDLELIYTKDILNTMERKEMTQGKKKVWEHRFQWLLFPAVVLFVLELFLPHGRGRKHFDPRALLGLSMAIVATGLLAAAPARAGLLSSPVKQGIKAYEKKDFHQAKNAFIHAQLQDPEDLHHYYNIGTAAYGAGEYDLAETNFVQAAQTKDMGLRQKALYNLANTRYRQGRLDQALKDYEDLLKAFPDDEQARENLGFVKQKLEEEKQRKSREKKDQEKKDQTTDQKDKDQKDKDQKTQKDKGQKDKGTKDPGKKDTPPRQPDSGDREAENKDPGTSGPDQKGEKNTAGDKKEGGQGETPPEPVPGQEKSPAPDKGTAGRAGAARPDAGAKMLENRLNRLEDKPGMALIPNGVSKPDRDW